MKKTLIIKYTVATPLLLFAFIAVMLTSCAEAAKGR
jgi:hypothetical protein